jgi:hypothetical protein
MHRGKQCLLKTDVNQTKEEPVVKKSSLYVLVAILFVAAMVLSACGPTPTAAPEATKYTRPLIHSEFFL